MTVIKKLVLNGFKSFGKWTDIPFTEGYNCVLGANGSGKSNIIDALCFVLGRMSSKGMRAEKLGYLVYNGGKTKKPAPKAEVSIFFDNSKRQFPLDTPAVKVSRLVKPDGQSIYRINDQKGTRQQIIDLLSVARIDPEGHNIVLQGDIIHFVEMSPEERRQVVEEIAGISVYEDKKQKAMSELDKVEQSLREADILLSERKTHLKELKQDRDQAIKYRELNDKIRQNKATLLNLQLARKESERQSIENTIAEHNKEIEKLRQEIDALKKNSAQIKESIALITKEIEEKGESEQVRLHKEIEGLRVDMGTASNRMAMCDTEFGKIAAKREALQKDHSEIEAKIQELKKSKAELEKAKVSKLTEKTRIEQGIEKIRKDSKVANIGDIELEIEKVEKDLELRTAESQALVERKQALLREKDKYEVLAGSVDSQIAKVRELEQEKSRELESVKSKREEYKRMVLELNQSLSEDTSYAAQAADAKRRLMMAEEAAAKLRAKTIVTRELNLAVQKVMEQREKIKGIYGTVAELGKVQSRYALALEVAAGPRINSIVVQNEEVAAECIRFLKQNKYGVASFLPLTKLKSDQPESKYAKAGGVQGQAIELVSYEPKYRKAFSYVFGNTLVVDSLDVAKRIGIGEARMVTLDGDLSELSGAMHGGFRQKKQLAFQEEEAEKELQEAESKARELEAAIDVLQKKRAENEQKISSLRQKKAELEGEIIRTEKSLSLEATDLDASTRIKQGYEQQISSAESELTGIQEKLNSTNRLISEIKGKKQALREKISELRNPAVVAELNAFEQKRRELIEEILKTENQLQQADAQESQVYTPEKERMTQILKQLDRDERQFTEEKGQLKAKTEQNKKLLAEAEEKARTFQRKYRELFENKSGHIEELQKSEEKTIRKEEQINTTEVRVNNVTLKSADVAASIAGLKAELEQYSDVQLLTEESEEKLKEHIYRYDRNLSEMGNVNLKALEIYEDVEKQYNSLLEKKEKLSSEKADVFNLMNEIEVKKKELFMNTFNQVNQNFIRIFNELSTKGDATLVIEDEEHLFDSGVRIRVNLTGEKFLDIRGLSGGEKSMTALALIFAMQEYSPASFYILDEVDAALDKKNSEKLSQLIKKYSEKAQYIVISHNDSVLTSASALYGISMDEHGISNVVSLKV